MQIHEPSIMDQALHPIGDVERLPHLLPSVNKRLAPLSHDMVVSDRPIIADKRDIHVEMLDPASWSHVFVGLSVQSRPVAYATHEAADVHEVEVFVRECPL